MTLIQTACRTPNPPLYSPQYNIKGNDTQETKVLLHERIIAMTSESPSKEAERERERDLMAHIEGPWSLCLGDESLFYTQHAECGTGPN